jgi:hypothetical protein
MKIELKEKKWIEPWHWRHPKVLRVVSEILTGFSNDFLRKFSIYETMCRAGIYESPESRTLNNVRKQIYT